MEWNLTTRRNPVYVRQLFQSEKWPPVMTDPEVVASIAECEEVLAKAGATGSYHRPPHIDPAPANGAWWMSMARYHAGDEPR